MALNGIGGNGSGSALDRFQQIRDQAKKKLDGADNRTRLTDLLKLKQSELGAGGSVKGPQAGVQAPKTPAARGLFGSQSAGASTAAGFLGGGQALKGIGTQGTGTQGVGAQGSGTQGVGAQGSGTQGVLGVSSAYGRAGGLEKTDPKPKLGRYIDFMA